jgi:hypothetical protein
VSDDAKPAHPPPWRRETDPTVAKLVHVELTAGPEDTVVIMRCGFTVIVSEDGSTDPSGADWFARPDERTTCQACRIASGLSPAPIDHEMEALLREETKSTLCLLAPLSGPDGVNIVAKSWCGDDPCWWCRVRALLVRIAEARKAAG